MVVTKKALVYAVATLIVGGIAVVSATRCLPIVHAQSRSEANRDAAREFKESDAKLNRVYAKLTAKLDKKSLAKLKTAQKAWIVFRDAQADLAQTVASQGGTLYVPYGYDEERAVQSDARTKDLEQLLNPSIGFKLSVCLLCKGYSVAS